MTYHWIHNTTGVTSPAGSAYPSGAPKFNLDFQWDSRCSIFSFLCSILWINACLSFDLQLLITSLALCLG